MGKLLEPVTIMSSGNETSFLWQLYYYFVGNESESIPSKLWDGITCTVYNGSTEAGNTPDDAALAQDTVTNIVFTLDENVSLTFQDYPHQNWSGGKSYGYNVRLSLGDINLIDRNWGNYTGGWGYGTGCLRHNDSEYGSGQSATRKYILTQYRDDNLIILWITPCNGSSYKDENSVCIMKMTNGNSVYWTGKNGQDILSNNENIVNVDNNSVYKINNMFNFEARTGYLDFISHSSFLIGNTKAFASTDIYDCTTVNFGDTLSLKDGANFLAIGAHSMVRLDDEEG